MKKRFETRLSSSSLLFFNLWLGNIFLNFSVSFVCLHDEWGGVVALLVDAGYSLSFYTVATCVSRTEKKSSFRLYVPSFPLRWIGRERKISKERCQTITSIFYQVFFLTLFCGCLISPRVMWCDGNTRVQSGRREGGLEWSGIPKRHYHGTGKEGTGSGTRAKKCV